MVKQFIIRLLCGSSMLERRFNTTSPEAATIIAQAIYDDAQVIDIKEV